MDERIPARKLFTSPAGFEWETLNQNLPRTGFGAKVELVLWKYTVSNPDGMFDMGVNISIRNIASSLETFCGPGQILFREPPLNGHLFG